MIRGAGEKEGGGLGSCLRKGCRPTLPLLLRQGSQLPWAQLRGWEGAREGATTAVLAH